MKTNTNTKTNVISTKDFQKGTLSRRQQRTAYIFIAMPLILFFIFTVIPFISSFYYSLTEYNIISPPEVIGFDNYRRLMHDPFFWDSLRNTFRYVIFFVPGVIICSLGSALLVSRQHRASLFFRISFYIPVLSSSVATSTIWLWLYNGEYGLINQGLELVGLNGQPWLNQTSTAMFAIIIMTVWSNIGVNMMLFLAALKNVPQATYEAAMIDGANGFQRLLKITLPAIKPTMFFVTMTTTIAAFQMFDQAYMLTGGSFETNTIMLYIYNTSFGNLNMGYGAAMAVILFFIILVISLFNYFINGKGGEN